ncbi:MAG TPA: hypothetical protein VND80_10425 [Steroidobacteraceae bacterium]|nr:hypothetical protein [Steroidobacteraceae bacterium]
MNRILPIAGALLIAAGLYILIKAPTYSSEHNVLKVGTLQANVREEKPVPPAIGGGALGIGCVLVVIGLTRKR